eukprot:TRINITY_DN67223_c7_g3_i1.p1 TRINITY_DN67223_c7_g3~~TRINITY_DN67223_c7_g3_i1.p1  ORF type:complete len:216 (-),score=19.67 TRINITY_DN67223_c7_g3_i1:27-674(-)
MSSRLNVNTAPWTGPVHIPYERTLAHFEPYHDQEIRTDIRAVMESMDHDVRIRELLQPWLQGFTCDQKKSRLHWLSKFVPSWACNNPTCARVLPTCTKRCITGYSAHEVANQLQKKIKELQEKVEQLKQEQGQLENEISRLHTDSTGLQGQSQPVQDSTDLIGAAFEDHEAPFWLQADPWDISGGPADNNYHDAALVPDPATAKGKSGKPPFEQP